MLRSASWATTIAAASVLFASTGSGVVLETVALLVTVVPAAARPMRATIVSVRVEPEASAPLTHVSTAPAAVQSGDETKRQTRRQGVAHPDIGGRTRPVVRDDERVVHGVAHRAGGDAAAFCIARSAAVPTVSRSVALLLESTGSGWVAVPVAVLASVVPAAPGWT